MRNSYQTEWQQREFEEHELSILHDPMSLESRFYEAVQTGNIEYVEADLERGDFAKMEGKGVLSSNPVQNLKYHFVISIALIARVCAVAGMTQEQAYRLSDFYINKADESDSIDDIIAIHKRMVRDYTGRMQILQKDKGTSIVVSHSLEYIYSHIHDRITIEAISEHVSISPSQLSRLFKKELGVSVSEFIRRKKLERAKNMLQYSDYSYIEIANYLAFASQSHFVSSFRRYVGMTPKKYRDLYYQATWEILTDSELAEKAGNGNNLQ